MMALECLVVVWDFGKSLAENLWPKGMVVGLDINEKF